eukprot:1867129-Amphidinium_carterae.2
MGSHHYNIMIKGCSGKIVHNKGPPPRESDNAGFRVSGPASFVAAAAWLLLTPPCLWRPRAAPSNSREPRTDLRSQTID